MMAFDAVIDLAIGDAWFPTPLHIKEAAQRAIATQHLGYGPHAGIPELREAIAQKLCTANRIPVFVERIIVTAGAKQAVDHVIRAIVRPGDEVLIIAPYFFAYPLQVKLAGGTPVFVRTCAETGFLPHLDEIEKLITGRTRLILLNSPCNPTGVVLPHSLLAAIVHIATKRGVLVVSDEVYEKTVYDGTEFHSVASVSAEGASCCITVGSFSKTYAMAGWRVGYLAAPDPMLADKITEIQRASSSGPSVVSQLAALAALQGDQSCVREMVTACEDQRHYMLDRISAMPYLRTYPPAGGLYCFVSVEESIGQSLRGHMISDAASFVRLLRKTAGVLAVSGGSFGAPNHMRLTFARDRKVLEEGLNRIDDLLAKG